MEDVSNAVGMNPHLIIEDSKINTKPYNIPPSSSKRAPNTVGKQEKKKKKEVYAICIENLSESTSVANISKLVSKFGRVAKIFVAFNKDTGACKGYAFVNFKSKIDAEQAIEGLHGYGYDHMILNVDWKTKNYYNKSSY